jgi:hypothetical protein
MAASDNHADDSQRSKRRGILPPELVDLLIPSMKVGGVAGMKIVP